MCSLCFNRATRSWIGLDTAQEANRAKTSASRAPAIPIAVNLPANPERKLRTAASSEYSISNL